MSRATRSAFDDVPPDGFDEDETEAASLDEAPEIDFDFEPGAVQAGTEIIRRFWSTLPNSPGVYRMFDAKGDVLYVGKAKNLKARVGSYARGQAHSNRIARMIAQTAAMEFVTTATETEALLLEANLIKQLKPRFNVLMRDDKSFPYILLTSDGPAPQIVKHRGARRRKGNYYGPFANVWAVNRTVNALQRAFLMRTCSDSYYENRTRPCLLYQIKRCSGPCTGEIALEDYSALADSARAFLSGKSNAVKDRMREEMQRASEALEFERAARFRDRIAALSAIQGVQGVNTQGVEEADVFAIDEQAGQFCIEVFFFRNFQNWGNRAYFPKADRSMSADEVLASFISQFYDDKPAPKLVLVSHTIEDAELVRRCPVEPGRAPRRGSPAAAGRAQEPRRLRAAQRQGGARTPARRHRLAGQVADGFGPSLRPRQAAAPRRGLRQLAHFRHGRGWRHDRRRTDRLHEDALPHLQHQVGGAEPRRRFRDDA
ncbi:UNVERIFIED_ORG: excinuclease UvrABC nuclease subunit [Methylorubrum zatmanii]|nr:excinuclease UvrABC nuclease subunit [Methylorubrum zatmanii]